MLRANELAPFAPLVYHAGISVARLDGASRDRHLNTEQIAQPLSGCVAGHDADRMMEPFDVFLV